jgi:hypothetical protein
MASDRAAALIASFGIPAHLEFPTGSGEEAGSSAVMNGQNHVLAQAGIAGNPERGRNAEIVLADAHVCAVFPFLDA